MNGSYAYGDGFDGRGSRSQNNRLVYDNSNTSPSSPIERSRQSTSLYIDSNFKESASFCFGNCQTVHDGHVQDPLRKEHDALCKLKPAMLTSKSSNAAPTKPGAQFCSSHDAVSAKIAEFERPQESRIEIAPGITARLRGAKETLRCVENDFYLPAMCFCCNTDLFCIMDANYVLCPNCKVVSPMEGCSSPGSDGGVGLGFTFQDLQQWQYEIVMRRHQRGG